MVITILLTTIISNTQESYNLAYLIWPIIRFFTQKIYIFKNFNSEFLSIEVWFSDQNSKPLEIEDN